MSRYLNDRIKTKGYDVISVTAFFRKWMRFLRKKWVHFISTILLIILQRGDVSLYFLTQARLTCTSYFECFSVNVSTIYCLNPKFRLLFVRNWVLLYINENVKRWARLSRSSYYRFTFLSLSFENLVQNKQIVQALCISTHQTLLRGKTQKFTSFFMVS